MDSNSCSIDCHYILYSQFFWCSLFTYQYSYSRNIAIGWAPQGQGPMARGAENKTAEHWKENLKVETLPEAQRTQGIDSMTWTILLTELNSKALFPISATRWCYLHWLPMWPLALISILATRWGHLHCHIAGSGYIQENGPPSPPPLT